MSLHSSIDEKLQLALQDSARGNYQGALLAFTELQKLAPERADINYHFGCALLAVEEFDSAIQQLSLACQKLPQETAPLFKLADAFESVNSIGDVETIMNFALKQFPSLADVFYRAANFYREIGELVKADELASRCLVLSTQPLLTSYVWLLRLNLGKIATVQNGAMQNAAMQNAQTALLQILDTDSALHEGTNNELKMITHFALGRYYELVNDEVNAFAHWKMANQIQHSFTDYSSAMLSSLFNAIKNNNVALPASDKPSVEFTPIFILGLPRTGSTLLEQALCRHADVSSLGEQALISDQVAGYISHHTQQPYPLFMPTLVGESGKLLCQNAAEIYQKSVFKRQLKTPFVIDKLPANFQSIGLIKSVFPHAKIIHLTRCFEDTALSIFKNHFAVNEPYLCDLGELSSYHRMYKDLMQHWDKTYPNEILTVSYESLVSEHESSIKQVLQYCGLTPHTGCWLAEADNATVNAPQRLVKTLSSAQVTQPVYKHALGGHGPYATLLAESGLLS